MEITQKITTNIAMNYDNMEILRKHFPECFAQNGSFNFDKFKSTIENSGTDISNESYGIDWLGKSYARLRATDATQTLLKEDTEWNNKPENINSENILIKGDNLDVLKHLSNCYREKIKMIYIDPPYNTGSDGFVYEDSRRFTVKELMELAGLNKDKAERILNFLSSKSNSHSAWLTFMYPRLYIAKHLLKDDGVIFVSIDDNEVAQLRLLMDEVFGEENFVDCLKWKRKKQPSFLATHTAKVTEYILVYSKYIHNLEKLSIEGTSDSNKKVVNLTNEYSERMFAKGVCVKLGSEGKIDRGKYLIKSMTVEYLNDVYYANNKTTNEVKVKAQFSVSQQKIDEYISKGLLFITSNKGLRRDVSPEEIGKRKSITDLLLDWGDNQDSDQEIQQLFCSNIFEYAKPVKLIYNLIKSNFTSNDIILDFFAGSGTTGDAVMQLNAQDGGKRKFILVQIAEEIDANKNKTSFDFVKSLSSPIDSEHKPSIFDITKERLVRAANKIKESKGNENIDENNKLDLGFKIFETIPIWNGYDFHVETLNPTTELFTVIPKEEEDLQILLTTWKTYDNITLTTKLEKYDFDGYPGYYQKNTLYLINNGFKINNLVKLLEEIDNNNNFSPSKIVVFGFSFDSKELREISESVNSYNNKKSLEIDFIIRY